MTRDSIVAEVYEAREKLLKECDDNLDKLMDRLQAAEAKDLSRLVSLETIRQQRQPQPVPTTKG